MEDYIYILIGVIWIAASIYKASQKAKKKAQSQSRDSQTQQDETAVPAARSLLEQLMNGQQVFTPEPEVNEYAFEDADPTPMVQERTAGDFQKEYARSGLGGLESLSGEGISSLGANPLKDKLKVSEEKRSSAHKIDLRKAIIYKAILERPYT